MARRGTPSKGPKLGSCLTLRNELSEEIHVLTKQEILLGKGAWVESSIVGNLGELLCHVALWCFMMKGLVFGLSLANHSDSESFIVQLSWMPARILGRDRTRGVSFWPFSNSSSWWWLISSLFLTRTSCRKTPHANGYYGAWPGWVVSVSVPLTHIYVSIIIIYLSWKIKIY